MNNTSGRFILQLSSRELKLALKHIHENDVARKALSSAAKIDDETFEFDCSVDEFQSVLKALRMKSGTERMIGKLILMKVNTSTKVMKAKKRRRR